jgi:hypothetical protein
MKSAIAVSMHKAGSSVADRIIGEILAAKGYELDRISLKSPKSPVPENQLFVDYQNSMQLEGVYYGMARGPYITEMPVIRRLRTVVQIRDPRDCITSAYFSIRKSHVPPKDPMKRKVFEERRRRFLNMSIDEYALSRVGNYRKRLDAIDALVSEHDDLLLLTYEQMVERTDEWLNRLGEFFNLPITSGLRGRLGNVLESPSDEDTSRHKRQVTPGDHRRKLSPDVIAKMDSGLATYLRKYGYET